MKLLTGRTLFQPILIGVHLGRVSLSVESVILVSVSSLVLSWLLLRVESVLAPPLEDWWVAVPVLGVVLIGVHVGGVVSAVEFGVV